jgi:hypothetical protein
MKAALSISISLLFCAMVAGGLYLSQRAEEAERSSRESASEFIALKEDVEALQEETRELKEELRRLDSFQEIRPAVEEAGAARAVPVQAAASASAAGGPDEIKAYVTAVLEEDRRKREEDRKQEREQLRQRSEEKRKERAALSEGPYERYNLKVNSLAKALALNEAQKQAYYELIKRSREDLRQGRKKDQAPGEAPAPNEPGRGPGRDDRRFRQLFEEAQKRFTEAVQGMLSPSQWEAYGQLSDSSRSFQDLGMVSTSGAEGANPGRARGTPPVGFQGKSGGPRRR